MIKIISDVATLEKKIEYHKRNLAVAKTRLNIAKKLGLRFQQAWRVKPGKTVRAPTNGGAWVRGKVISVEKTRCSGYAAYKLQLQLSTRRVAEIITWTRVLVETNSNKH